jgi:hypothetical protein
MSLTEILAEIPKLSFAERQELVRRAIEVEDLGLTAEEKIILDQRLADFRQTQIPGSPPRATSTRPILAKAAPSPSDEKEVD